MSEFHIRSDSVDVERIMEQIRARIREKRGVDYTEDEVRELAAVRLEKFLDPKNLRSDLLEQFRRSRPALPDPAGPVQGPVPFDDQTLFSSHRAPLRFVRKLLRPLLVLFFNPNTLNHVIHSLNVEIARQRLAFDRSRAEWNALYYEVLHNLVLETTRNTIELRNLKMRLESVSSRLDFNERRVRALEGVVQYRPDALRPRNSRGEIADVEEGTLEDDDGSLVPTGEGAPQGVGAVLTAEGRRRRRRRRGRRGGGGAAAAMVDRGGGTASAPAEPPGGTASGERDTRLAEPGRAEPAAADDVAEGAQGGADAREHGGAGIEPEARSDAESQ
jgi:hypothetical protein